MSHPFWQFSVTVYSRAQVADACLKLQNDYRLDVNVVLFCCWAGSVQPQPMPKAGLRAALDSVRGWQDGVITKLRSLRRDLPQYYPGQPTTRLRAERLREQLKQLELDAEHIEQLLLAEHGRVAITDNTATSAPFITARRMLANLLLYCDLLELERTPQLVKLLLCILAGCLPALDATELAALAASL